MRLKNNNKKTVSVLAAMLIFSVFGIANAEAESFYQGVTNIESSGNLTATNQSSTAIGGDQLTEAALAQAGYITINSPVTAANYGGNMTNVTWTGKNGATSEQAFLDGPNAATIQQDAFNDYASSVWSADESAGIASDVGQTVNGQTLNQSAILAGSYNLGTGGMETYIQTGSVYVNSSGGVCSPSAVSAGGCTASPALTAEAEKYISQASQFDSSAITGSNATVAEGSAGTSSGSSPGSAANGIYCNPTVAKVLQSGAYNYVNQQKEMAESPQTGFTLLNGTSLSQAAGTSGSPSSSGGIGGLTGSFGEFSCLTNLLGGNISMLFTPPSLSSILQALENQVCQEGESLITQAIQPLDQSQFEDASIPGFFPGMNAINLGSSVSTTASSGGSGFSFTSNAPGIGSNDTSWWNGSTSSNTTSVSPTYFNNLLSVGQTEIQ